ncbi:histidine phosphatase family protein [Actinacidiphila sp. DG2A-62]|uniref:histidine phosphatase family protein n=1 Tax=Actinacidiphila sp. DG2A-62 TaxID=3108821 RepID=UPI003FA387EF
MTTILLRHASTSYSARYLVNGDPGVRLPLDAEGVAACHVLRASGSLRHPHTWVTSAFLRAQQTTILLAGPAQLEPRIDARLNELDYGDFEGGPFLDYADWLGLARSVHPPARGRRVPARSRHPHAHRRQGRLAASRPPGRRGPWFVAVPAHLDDGRAVRRAAPALLPGSAVPGSSGHRRYPPAPSHQPVDRQTHQRGGSRTADRGWPGGIAASGGPHPC